MDKSASGTDSDKPVALGATATFFAHYAQTLHHRLEALRRMYPKTKKFDWNTQSLTDGQMIQMMARENGESYKTDAGVLRETITATVKALGEGKIRADELPIPEGPGKQHIRYAPGFSLVPPADHVLHPYTVDAIAKFLGETKSSTGKAHDAFNTTFSALELISEGYLKESATFKPRCPYRYGEDYLQTRMETIHDTAARNTNRTRAEQASWQAQPKIPATASQ